MYGPVILPALSNSSFWWQARAVLVMCQNNASEDESAVQNSVLTCNKLQWESVLMCSDFLQTLGFLLFSWQADPDTAFHRLNCFVFLAWQDFSFFVKSCGVHNSLEQLIWIEMGKPCVVVYRSVMCPLGSTGYGELWWPWAASDTLLVTNVWFRKQECAVVFLWKVLGLKTLVCDPTLQKQVWKRIN